LNIEIYELFITPLSPRKELERLYETVAKNIDKVVCEAIGKALSDKCKE
jgi:hypothetical protein